MPLNADFLADRQLEWCDAGAELLLQVRQRAVEGGPVPVELVDEDESAEPELGGEAPRGEGLGLDPFDGAHDDHDEVDHRAGGSDLSEEVGVSGGVDEVDLDVADSERRHRQARPTGAA